LYWDKNAIVMLLLASSFFFSFILGRLKCLPLSSQKLKWCHCLSRYVLWTYYHDLSFFNRRSLLMFRNFLWIWNHHIVLLNVTKIRIWKKKFANNDRIILLGESPWGTQCTRRVWTWCKRGVGVPCQTIHQ